MNGENLARYSKATEEEGHAFEEVKEIIGRFQKAANQLKSWQKVTFSWHDKDTFVGPLPKERDENTIVIEQVPNLLLQR
jgi:hypothetical protein